MAKDYDLDFVPASKGVGLRGIALAENNPNSTVTTRELIQNALDARKGDSTEISFDLENIPLEQLPGIEQYREAFGSISKKHRDKAIYNTIKEHLSKKEIQVLWVADKGKGLDSHNMNKLLDDGNSDKSTGLGSYGVGHLVAFLSSSLRYVVYGGCSSEGQILSGQCILATFGPGKELRGPDGYVIVKAEQPDMLNRQFPRLADLKEGLWKDRLDKMKKEGTGSFVCITGFNHFLEKGVSDQKTEEDIAYAASCHFMPAIFEGKMKVRIGRTKLSKTTLEEIIGSRKEEKRRAERSEYGVAGARFYSLYECLRREKSTEVPLSNNDRVKIFLDKSPKHDRSVIHLYRQGMWITDKVSGVMPADFSDYRPFTAIILIERESAPKLNDIITSAEGPKHVEIDERRLEEDDKEEMKNLFKEIRLDLQGKIKKNEEKDEISDVLQHEKSGVVKIRPGGKYNPRIPKPPKPELVDPPEDPPDKPPKTPSGTKSNRKGKQIIIAHTHIVDEGKVMIAGFSDKDYELVEVSLSDRSGSDESCDNPERDGVVFLEPISEYQGTSLDISKHISRGEDEGYSAVKLGGIKKGILEITLTLAAAAPPPFAAYEVVFTSMAKGKA